MDVGDKVKVLFPFEQAYPGEYYIVEDVTEGFRLQDIESVFDPMYLEVVNVT